MTQQAADLCLFRNLMPRTVVKAAYEVLRMVTIAPGSLYVSAGDLVPESQLQAQLDRVLPSPMGRLLIGYCHILQGLLDERHLKEFDGFEIWSNLSFDCKPKVVLHVDNDENQRQATGNIRSPLVGSIFYLGPTSPPEGGGTMFCLDDKLAWSHEPWFFQSIDWEVVSRALGPGSVIVPFEAGRTILFRGNLAHCVTPIQKSVDGRPRVALLINVWSNRILSVPQGQIWADLR
jgi:hypothetical protein